MKILDRKIITEQAGGFAIGLVAALVLLTGDYLLAYNDVLFSSRVPAPVVIQLLILKLPAYAVLAIPMAVLLSLTIALARMARDFELSALRASGLPLRRIMLPCLAFGLLASALSFALLEYAAPPANARARKIESGYLMSRALQTVRAERFVKGPRGTTLRVGELAPNGLNRELQVIKRCEDGIDWAVAPSGFFSGDRLVLEDATHFSIADTGEVTRSLRSASMTLDVGRASGGPLSLSPTPFEKDRNELKAEIDRWKQANVSLPQKETELYFKYSLPCASAVFVALGFPLSVGAGRRETLGAVLVCAWLVLVYYLLMTAGKGAGYHELVDPRLAAWLPNAILGGTGLVLLHRVARS